MLEPLRDQALARLQQLLTKFEADLVAASENKHVRGGTKEALQACADLIDSFESMRLVSLSAPILNLRVALDDLDRGARPPLLSPIEDKQRPPGNTARQIMQAWAIFAVDLLKDERGMTLKNACVAVATALSDAGIPVQGKLVAKTGLRTESWLVVKRWRDDLQKLSPKAQSPSMLKGLNEEVRPRLLPLLTTCSDEQAKELVVGALQEAVRSFGRYGERPSP